MRTALVTLWAVIGLSLTAHALDQNSYVFVIVMENQNWSSIKGNPDAPYINNTLLPTASYCDQYYNPPNLHPSEPNYLWLEAGTNFNVSNDGTPALNQQSSNNHLVTQLSIAGISWRRTYQENISGNDVPLTDNYPYLVHHNPFAYFTDITSDTNYAIAHIRPFTELASDITNNNLAHYNFITPNMFNDMHDLDVQGINNPVRQGDNWLEQHLPTILDSPAYRSNGLVLILWDEGQQRSDGPIGCIVLSPFAKGRGYHNSIPYTHSSTLRTLQKIYGQTQFLGEAAISNDLSDLLIKRAFREPHRRRR